MIKLNREFLEKIYYNDLINEDAISINGLKINAIDSEALRGLTKLKKLDLGFNKIEEIGSHLFETLPILGQLLLNNNKLKIIDSNTFKENPKLLWRLECFCNEITEISPNSFESLSKLEILTLNNNKLKTIESNTFWNLTNLETLTLSYNEISEIKPNSFQSLSSLIHLNLNNNKLKTVDSSIFKGLTKLEVLSLESNEISEIGLRSFEELLSLKRLSLNNNKLEKISSNTLKGLKNMEKLSLNHNCLVDIDSSSFVDLSNLTHLFLNNNKLHRIDSNTFKSLKKLWLLALDFNEISLIDTTLFENLSYLDILKLNNNRLKEIDRKCFQPLSSILVLQLYENNLKADILSFYDQNSSISFFKIFYDEIQLDKNGFESNRSKFLEQFPEIEATKIEDKFVGLLFSNRYLVEKKLGSGSFGSVYLVNDIKIEDEGMKRKAMKIMDKLEEETENELKIIWEIKHENILRYFDHFHLEIGSERMTCVIIDYCENGDLFKKILDAKNSSCYFTKRQIFRWIYQSTSALKYLHFKNIIHRDVKPANMLLTRKNEIKIADLGLAKQMIDTHASSFAGTQMYMSPEMFRAKFKRVQYYPNTDIWSLGCVLYELVFLERAFPKGQRENPPIPSNISASGPFSNILSKMLEKDFNVRIDAEKLENELKKLNAKRNFSIKNLI